MGANLVVKTFIMSRYQIDVTLIGLKFFAWLGSFPSFGIAVSKTKKRWAHWSSLVIQSFSKVVTISPIIGFDNNRCIMVGCKPNDPGAERELSADAAYKNLVLLIGYLSSS